MRRPPCFVAGPSHCSVFLYAWAAQVADGRSSSDMDAPWSSRYGAENMCKGRCVFFLCGPSDTELTRLYLPASMQMTTSTARSYSKLSVRRHVSVRTQVHGTISARREVVLTVFGAQASRVAGEQGSNLWAQLCQDCMTT